MGAAMTTFHVVGGGSFNPLVVRHHVSRSPKIALKCAIQTPKVNSGVIHLPKHAIDKATVTHGNRHGLLL